MTAPGLPGAFFVSGAGQLVVWAVLYCRGYNARYRTGYFNPCMKNLPVVILRLQSASKNLVYYEKWVAENTYQSRQNKIY